MLASIRRLVPLLLKVNGKTNVPRDAAMSSRVHDLMKDFGQ